VRAIQKRLGATFVFVTHDQTEALVMSDRIAIMNNGRIVQHGTPRDIYRRPNSVFVSDFVGATNLLHGTIAAIEPGRVVMQSEHGPLFAPRPGTPIREGQRAALSLRPEAIRLHPAAGSAARGSSLAGRVAEIIYQGNSVRVGARLASGAVIWAEARDEEADGLAPGDAVTLAWAENAATILGEESQ
jgi:ABC-type Fe3+/spermidine/putrescine transport system ATPase subunit